MPSLKYKMTAGLFKHTVKSMLSDGTKEQFIDYVYSMAPKRALEVPSQSWQNKFRYEEVEEDEMTVIKIGPKKSTSDKLVLYYTGDGLYQPPSAADFEVCGDIVKNTGIEVWLVSYPLITSTKPEGIMHSVYMKYLDALKEYKPENITLMGLSSGGTIALGLCFFIREKHPEQPLPGRILLQSPMLCSPPTEEQLAKMKEIEPDDVLLGTNYFRYLAATASFMGYEYLVRPMKYSMEGFPPVDLFYGTAECAYAYLEDFRKRCAQDHVSLNVHIGEGMMKCWCLLTATPEAKKVKEEYYKILKG